MNVVEEQTPNVWPIVEEIALDDAFIWRFEKFDNLGFTLEQRAKLAAVGADWHRAQKLLGQGCPVHLVFDILS